MLKCYNIKTERDQYCYWVVPAYSPEEAAVAHVQTFWDLDILGKDAGAVDEYLLIQSPGSAEWRAYNVYMCHGGFEAVDVTDDMHKFLGDK